ncbi:MAG: DUF3783 domain-containing protein [Fervidobacterium sp.]|nr:DUF3783 domain-containing protein [Fervidobacterium sp.]
MEKKVVLLHNFEEQDILRVMKLLKEAFNEEIIFATTTPTSLKWTVETLLMELNKEHEEFKKLKE